MQIPLRGIALTAALLCFSLADARTLTFSEARDMALKNSNLIKSYQADENAALYAKREAEGAYLPNVALHQTYMSSDEPGTAAYASAQQGRFDNAYYATMSDPSRVTNYTTKLTVMQPVFMQGQIYFGIKQASEVYDASRLQTERMSQYTLYNLHQAFYGLALAEKALDVANRSYERTARYYKSSQEFFRNGLIVQSDLLVAESRMLMSDQAVKEAEKQKAVAESQLQRLLDTDDHLEIVWNTPDIEFSNDLDGYLAKGTQNRQDLKAMEKYLAVTDIDTDKAKTKFLPSVYLFADYQRNDDKFLGDNGNGTTYGVQADLNLFNGLMDSNRLKETKSRHLSMLHKIADKRLEIKSDIKSSYYGVIAASKQTEASEKRVEAAQAALTITENRFNAGLSKVTELLDREVDLKQAELALYMAEYQLITEKAGLHFAVGDLR